MENNDKLYFYQKFVVILGYMCFASEYPYIALFMLIFFRDDYVKMHINRLLFLGIINTIVFLLNYNNISIPYFSINTFILIISIIGMVQTAISNKHQILIIDKLPLVWYSDYKKVPIWISIIAFVVIIIVSCIVRC